MNTFLKITGIHYHQNYEMIININNINYIKKIKLSYDYNNRTEYYIYFNNSEQGEQITEESYNKINTIIFGGEVITD